MQHDSSVSVPSVFVGIDVSKATLDCHIDPVGERLQFTNDEKGIARLVAHLQPQSVQRVVIEATGRLHRQVAGELTQAGIAVALVNPQRARDYARSLGKLEKTDRIDACVLARFAQISGHQIMQKPREKQVELDDLISRRRALVQMRIAEKNRLAETHQPELAKKQAKKMLRLIDEQIDEIDAAIAKLIDGEDDWKRKSQIITSIPGVSTITANQLLAELPELGDLSRQSIAKLAGLAPLANDSGPRKGPRSIRGGRQTVRNTIYMAAFNTIRWCDRFKQFADRLKKGGKPFKVVLIAAMRKLLITLNQMIKTNTVYNRTIVAGTI